MRPEWTDRELQGIELLLREQGVDPTKETAENNWLRCHEQVIFNKPLGDFTAEEWRAIGQKLDRHDLVAHRRDYAWDVNYGRLVPLLSRETVVVRMRRDLAENICVALSTQETVVIRMRRELAKELCVALSSQPSGVAWDAKAVIEKALGE
jgi:hypothetical protein